MLTEVNPTIFPSRNLYASEGDWADHLQTPTPIQRLGDLTFKRDDTFAPLGYGGINGSKLRQLSFMVSEHVRDGGSLGMVTGASGKSPQLPMGAAVANHYGMESILVMGGSNPSSSYRSTNVQIASWFGATFDYRSNSGFNASLQKRCRDLIDEVCGGWFYLEYGITRDHAIHDSQAVFDFHDIAAAQVTNIPDHITDLVVPAGSCNSATSILRGLVKHPKPNLKDIWLIGIGPPKRVLIDERMRIFSEITGHPHNLFAPSFDDPHLDYLASPTQGAPYRLHLDDLHSDRIIRYHDRVPWHYMGIDFHPTYEGKVMRHLLTNRTDLVKPTTCMWIVGSEPGLNPMKHALARITPQMPEMPRIANRSPLGHTPRRKAGEGKRGPLRVKYWTGSGFAPRR